MGFTREEKIRFARQLRRNPTVAEKIIWEKIRRKQLGYWIRRQKIILGWIVDFYCPRFRMVIEIDGASHDEKFGDDVYRDTAMEEAGYLVIRFSNKQVFDDPDKVAWQIKNYIDISLKFELERGTSRG